MRLGGNNGRGPRPHFHAKVKAIPARQATAGIDQKPPPAAVLAPHWERRAPHHPRAENTRCARRDAIFAAKIADRGRQSCGEADRKMAGPACRPCSTRGRGGEHPIHHSGLQSRHVKRPVWPQAIAKNCATDRNDGFPIVAQTGNGALSLCLLEDRPGRPSSAQGHGHSAALGLTRAKP